MRELKSPEPDPKGMEERADEARLREILGEPLSERDHRILQVDAGVRRQVGSTHRCACCDAEICWDCCHQTICRECPQ